MNTVVVPTLTINPQKLLRVALEEIKSIKRRYAELEEDNRARAKDGWARSNYCVHGTYIGDPYGGDFLCWACEDGLTPYEWAAGNAHKRAERAKAQYEKSYQLLTLYALPFVEHREPSTLVKALGWLEEEIAVIRKIEEEWA